MNHFFLAIDFGATNTKACLVSLNSGELAHPYSCGALQNSLSSSPFFEISALDLQKQFLEIAHYYWNLNFAFEGIVISSQMHGFMLLDEKNKPLSNYISWQDERSLLKIENISSFDWVSSAFSESFQSITGISLRPGLPYVNAFHWCRNNKSLKRKKIKLIALPEWLALTDVSCSKVHPQMIAGSGFWDIEQQGTSSTLTEFINTHTNTEIFFNTVANEREVAGFIQKDRKKIPIYVGVGDHQCALLGAGLKEHMISLNLGTGSQVSKLNGETSGFEKRPYFKDDYLLTRTHIPAGRALNEYLRLLTSAATMLGVSQLDVWRHINTLTVEEVLNSTLEIDLGLFQSAANYDGGGKIKNISSGKLEMRHYLSSLIKCFVYQYLPILNKIDPAKKINTYLFSGGLVRKSHLIQNVFSNVLGVEILKPTSTEETLLGLGKIATSITNGFVE